jgi:hypothetical protein
LINPAITKKKAAARARKAKKNLTKVNAHECFDLTKKIIFQNKIILPSKFNVKLQKIWGWGSRFRSGPEGFLKRNPNCLFHGIKTSSIDMPPPANFCPPGPDLNLEPHPQIF